MPKQGYTQLPSGYWTKDSDASSPYLFNGEEMIFFTGTGSGGGVAPEVDVLSTVIPKFENNTEVPEDGDTLQTVLDKFYTFDRAFPTEVLAVSLSGFNASNAKITASDTIIQALGKAQGQIDNLPSPPAAYTDAKVRAVALTGVVFTDATEIVATDSILKAFGKTQAQIDEIKSGGSNMPDVLNTKMTGLNTSDKTHGVPEDTILKFAGKAEARIRNLESNGAPFNLMAYKFDTMLVINGHPQSGDTFETWSRKVNYLFTIIDELKEDNDDLTARLKKVYSELGWSWTEGTP